MFQMLSTQCNLKNFWVIFRVTNWASLWKMISHLNRPEISALTKTSKMFACRLSLDLLNNVLFGGSLDTSIYKIFPKSKNVIQNSTTIHRYHVIITDWVSIWVAVKCERCIRLNMGIGSLRQGIGVTLRGLIVLKARLKLQWEYIPMF